MRALSIAWIGVAGCGRLWFEPLDGAADAADVADAADARCGWEPGFRMTAPTGIVELSTPLHEAEPFLMPDGLSVYFAALTGSWDVYLATRPTIDAPFNAPTMVTDLSQPMYQETRLAVSADGASAFLSTDRAGSQTIDIFVTQRTGPSSFGPLQPVPELNTIDYEYDPILTADGLRMYFMRLPGADGTILLATRATTSSSFVVSTIPELESPSNDSNPAISADERVIVFTTDRPGGLGLHDLWYATRGGPTEAWSPPQPVPDVNTPSQETEPFLTGDGCELWFSSSRPGGAGNLDIYRASFIPP